MSKSRSTQGDRLRATGFDLSQFDRSTGHWRVRCSQCEAAVTNEIPCHEHGCPNHKKASFVMEEED